MSEFLCEGSVHHEITIATDEGRNGAAKAFRDLYGAWPQSVGDVLVLGSCESCSQPIFDGEKHHADSEGIQWHCAAHCCECEPETPTPAG